LAPALQTPRDTLLMSYSVTFRDLSTSKN
jgi:hypothetical protein